MYLRRVLEPSLRGQPVPQPTGEEMFRYLQAFQSVQDALLVHPVERKLTVRRPIIQIRMSVLATTTTVFLIALCSVILSHKLERRDRFGDRLSTPSSQTDWMVQAALECHREDDEYPWITKSDDFLRHDDLVYVVSARPDGRLTPGIVSLRTVKGPFMERNNVTEPFLDYFDPASLYELTPYETNTTRGGS